jgi:hypothetical protein
MARSRPIGVTVVAIIVLVNGALSTIGSIIALTSGQTVSGIIGLILGILTLLVALGLFSRSQIARILTTIVLVLNLASAIFSIGAVGFGNVNVIWPIISAVLSIVGVVLLYNKQANSYFR